MSAEPGRPQPGPNNDDLTSLIQQIAPRLAVYIRSATCGSGLGHADADEILQNSLLKITVAVRDPSRCIENHQAFCITVTANCILDHFRRNPRRTVPLDGDSLLADSRSPAPDHAAEQSEELEKCHRRQQQLNQWIGRVIPLLDGLLAEFVELNRIKENLPVTGNDVEPAPPRPGRPTNIEKAHQILEQLPNQISWLREFLRELR